LEKPMQVVRMIRHGRPFSAWGEAEPDPGLDALGAEQASAACAALLAGQDPPVRIVSSPLRRCRETAAPLAAALGLEVEIDSRVGEIPTPARLPSEGRQAWLGAALAGRWDELEEPELYDRWRRGVADALSQHAGAAVFSHFVAINAAVSSVSGEPRVVSVRPDFASITSFNLTPRGLTLGAVGAQASTQVL